MNNKTIYSLNGSWDLSFTLPDSGKKIKTAAPVPGNTEPVLKELGLIDDYMPADSFCATQKFEEIDDWRFKTEFNAPKIKNGSKLYLVFEGIDTVAEIYLNGEHIKSCRDMHITYRIDVSDSLKENGNRLEVIIRSSELWAREKCGDMLTFGRIAASLYDSQARLRKARHQWGWDNAPRLLTAGIFRPVFLEEIPAEHFETVYLYTHEINNQEVLLGARWIYKTDKKSLANHQISVSLLDGDTIIYEETTPVFFVQGLTVFGVPRNKVELWQPNGFGTPKLYTVRLEMLNSGKSTAVYESPFGIRTLCLERSEDVSPSGEGEFVFRINGEKVFIRGTNWKPLSPLASEADRELKTARALNEIKNLNCNMVRIWGGGIYENDFFFKWCDENGIMVWQDFMFACEVPASSKEYCRLVETEARQIVEKYRNHPSLAVWCGDNENDECAVWVNNRSQYLPSNSVITRNILKNAALHYDPYRCYIESSPYASDSNFLQRNKDMTRFQPEIHLYPSVLDFSKTLRSCKSLFIGETGPILLCAAAINDEILSREKSRAERLWNSERLRDMGIHQDDGYFTVWRTEGKKICEAIYGRDFSFNEWNSYALAINIVCAEVFKDVIEYSRAVRWRKTGVIWWSLIDMWPMLFNYSVIDYSYNKKLPYFWIKNSQQEFALMAVRKEIGGSLALYAANDTLVSHTASYSVYAYNSCCEKRMIAKGVCSQEKNSTGFIENIDENVEGELLIIRWSENGKTYTNHAFTKTAPFDVMRRWVEIIGRECGFHDEILELRNLNKEQ